MPENILRGALFNEDEERIHFKAFGLFELQSEGNFWKFEQMRYPVRYSLI